MLVTIYSLRSDLVVATVYLRKPPPSISDRTRGPRACSLLRLAAAVRSVLFSGSPLRCRRALPPPPTFYSVAALSSPTFGGLAALLSSFPQRTSKKLGPLSSSRRRIPSMRGRRRQIQTTTNTTPATGRHGDAGELLSSTTTRRWRVGAVRDGPAGRRRGRQHPSPPPSSWRRWPRASGDTSFPASSSAEAAGEAPLLCQLVLRHHLVEDSC